MLFRSQEGHLLNFDARENENNDDSLNDISDKDDDSTSTSSMDENKMQSIGDLSWGERERRHVLDILGAPNRRSAIWSPIGCSAI